MTTTLNSVKTKMMNILVGTIDEINHGSSKIKGYYNGSRKYYPIMQVGFTTVLFNPTDDELVVANGFNIQKDTLDIDYKCDWAFGDYYMVDDHDYAENIDSILDRWFK